MNSDDEKTTFPDPETMTSNPGDTAASTDLGDFRLSWIYKLRKDQIDIELAKFQLDPAGTVEEKKKRLVKFIKEGCASPQPAAVPPSLNWPLAPPIIHPPPVTTAPNVIPTQPVPTFGTSQLTVAERVRKWNVHFNGRTDAVEFLERLQDFQEHSGISTNALLPVLYEIFQGSALAWYRNNRTRWQTWENFVRDFRIFYYPVNYLEDLEAEISRRVQKPTEPAMTYVTDLQTLIRRHGSMTPEQELLWLYRNLLPDYRQYIHRTELTDVSALTDKIKTFETLRQELRQVYGDNTPDRPEPPRRNHNPIPVKPSYSPFNRSSWTE